MKLGQQILDTYRPHIRGQCVSITSRNAIVLCGGRRRRIPLRRAADVMHAARLERLYRERRQRCKRAKYARRKLETA